MRCRIGVNAGDVMAKEGDIFSDGVNVTAQLLQHPHGQFAGLARARLSLPESFSSHGRYR
jgi:class 3 adenylate cyclase